MAVKPLDVEAILIGLNEEKRIAACVSSIREAWAQVSHDPIRITYVDSGSTDQSLVIAARDVDRVLVLKSSPSAAAGRAAGAREATCEWILHLDGDMQLDSGWFEYVISRQDILSDARVCGLMGIRTDYVRNRDAGTNSILSNVYGVTREREASHIGGALMARRTALAKVGGYRCDLPTGEEPELLARLKDAGFHVVEVPKQFIVHFVDDPQSSLDRIRAWTSRGKSPRRSFAKAFLYALRGGYLSKLLRIYYLTTATWMGHSLTAIMLLRGSWVGAAIVQGGLVGFLISKGRPAEWLLSILRVLGIVEELTRGAAGEGSASASVNVRYREFIEASQYCDD